jgi:broad specificity phosphatase PhoE
MTNLLLVRHSEPAWGPENPPSKWELTERGRERCRLLGEYLRQRGVGEIFASSEIKAIETAKIAAEIAGVSSVVSDTELREHDRDATRKILSSADRRSLVIECMRKPDELIYGSVTVGEARDRFGGAVNRLMETVDSETVAMVAHGTVICSWIGQLLDIDPVPIWDSIGLPGIIEIEWPNPSKILDQRKFE